MEIMPKLQFTTNHYTVHNYIHKNRDSYIGSRSKKIEMLYGSCAKNIVHSSQQYSCELYV